jgi:hypothetical protein
MFLGMTIGFHGLALLLLPCQTFSAFSFLAAGVQKFVHIAFLTGYSKYALYSRLRL